MNGAAGSHSADTAADPIVERGRLMRREIQEQPGAWNRLLHEATDPVGHAAALIREHQPTQFVFLARGSSDNAAIYGQYLFQIELRTPAYLSTPSVGTLHGKHSFPPGACVVAVSQSGASLDLVHTLKAARAAGCTTVAITNTEGSPLSREADAHVAILAGPETSVAATKTYTGELLALWMLVQAVKGSEPRDLHLPQLGTEVLKKSADACTLVADAFRSTQRLLVVGRGLGYASAREAALKLMETSYVLAQGMSAADAEHGPVAVLDDSTPLLAFATAGPALDSMRSVVRIARAAGAPVEVIGDGSVVGDIFPPVLPRHVDPTLTPLLDILPAQLLALELSVLRGANPDQPRYLSKVTLTR
ncbi:MAG: hypothetical protein JWR55_671 [Aeromicrobium sp.]|jgi:glucosamine--fructose-6-phosphate aminotransferase (isomerizing)|nr:hypothetical protein [Aeromicrobium sp.]